MLIILFIIAPLLAVIVFNAEIVFFLGVYSLVFILILPFLISIYGFFFRGPSMFENFGEFFSGLKDERSVKIEKVKNERKAKEIKSELLIVREKIKKDDLRIKEIRAEVAKLKNI
jgi:hypothetical protein